MSTRKYHWPFDPARVRAVYVVLELGIALPLPGRRRGGGGGRGGGRVVVPAGAVVVVVGGAVVVVVGGGSVGVGVSVVVVGSGPGGVVVVGAGTGLRMHEGGGGRVLMQSAWFEASSVATSVRKLNETSPTTRSGTRYRGRTPRGWRRDPVEPAGWSSSSTPARRLPLPRWVPGAPLRESHLQSHYFRIPPLSVVVENTIWCRPVSFRSAGPMS